MAQGPAKRLTEPEGVLDELDKLQPLALLLQLKQLLRRHARLRGPERSLRSGTPNVAGSCPEPALQASPSLAASTVSDYCRCDLDGQTRMRFVRRMAHREVRAPFAPP